MLLRGQTTNSNRSQRNETVLYVLYCIKIIHLVCLEYGELNSTNWSQSLSAKWNALEEVIKEKDTLYSTKVLSTMAMIFFRELDCLDFSIMLGPRLLPNMEMDASSRKFVVWDRVKIRSLWLETNHYMLFIIASVMAANGIVSARIIKLVLASIQTYWMTLGHTKLSRRLLIYRIKKIGRFMMITTL